MCITQECCQNLIFPYRRTSPEMSYTLYFLYVKRLFCGTILTFLVKSTGFHLIISGNRVGAGSVKLPQAVKHRISTLYFMLKLVCS